MPFLVLLAQFEKAIWYNSGVAITLHTHYKGQDTLNTFKRKIIQLETYRDTTPMPSSTKHVYHGPATLLQTTYDTGEIHTTKFDYTLNATIESLIEIQRDLRK